MPTSTYEQFREAVLKAASPEHKAEILELKFGCNCEWGIYKLKFLSEGINRDNGIMSRFFLKEDGQTRLILGTYDSERETKIIGRDLTLEDVLRVMFPLFIYGMIRDEAVEVLKLWDFGYPAHLQSDETLLEIIKILK